MLYRMEANSAQALPCPRPSFRLLAILCALLVLLADGSLSRGKAPAEKIADQIVEPWEEETTSEVTTKSAAEFDKWESIADSDNLYLDNTAKWNDPSVKVIDWVRHFGFRHSSTDGRHSERGVPLQGTSWLNRPYHADWFIGSLLGDELIAHHVDQNNELFAGVRIGYDFDYYWGLDWRLGWSKPNIGFADPDPIAANGSYFLTDIDLKYYPWGDSKVRPYYLLGAGLARINFTDDTDIRRNVTLATMPLGLGLEFPQFPWLTWRLEVLDNFAFGADGIETLNNFSLTAGMEWRIGARPQSYWPWRSSRTIW